MASSEPICATKANGKKRGGYRGGPGVDGRLGAASKRRRADVFAARLRPTLTDMQASGLSLSGIAAELNRRGILTAQGTTDWTAPAVRRVLARSQR